MIRSVKEQITTLPEKPGVYRYYDREGDLLYIGKAKNLKKRVSSYFMEKNNKGAKLEMLVRQIFNIEYTIVANEKDALLLEDALIKSNQPKYNIALKDDKSYPYIKILNEPIPRIFFTRKKDNSKDYFFGPYTSVREVKILFDLIKTMYPTRNCNLNLSPKNIQKGKFKVCLEYHVGNCLGPCAQKQSAEQYDQGINNIKKILNGKVQEVQNVLKKQLEDAIENLAFEEAAQINTRIIHLKDYLKKSTIINPKLGDQEVYGYYEENDKAYVNYLSVVEGTIIKTKTYSIKKNLEETKEEILLKVIIDSLGEQFDQKSLILQFQIPNETKLKQIIPTIGDKKKLLELAIKNAIQYKFKEGVVEKKEPPFMKILNQIKIDLKLKSIPFHIECFDNSNFHGSFPVSSMVVFKNAKPCKKEYRHYNVKTVIGPNDFATMEEIVYRRYKRLIEEEKKLPDLIVIDGGKGQLSSAIKSLKELDIFEKVQIISIAKRLEEIYYPNNEIPMHLHKKSETMRVLQHIRNEAHHFGITFHRLKRSQGTFKSDLESIPGIGKIITEKLLKTFKSIKKLKLASFEQLELEIGKSKAKIVFDALKE